jgi:hypothetical protein
MNSQKHAKDLWQEIQKDIWESSALFFDLTGFRPNVVLELGYALAWKEQSQIFITYRTRKVKGQKPNWILSDISHLNRQCYIHVNDLQQYVEKQINNMEYIKNWHSFKVDCESTGACDKYFQAGCEILKGIRNDGPKSTQQINTFIKGTSCRLKKLMSMLKKNNLIKGSRGKHQRYDIMFTNW